MQNPYLNNLKGLIINFQNLSNFDKFSLCRLYFSEILSAQISKVLAAITNKFIADTKSNNLEKLYSLLWGTSLYAAKL